MHWEQVQFVRAAKELFPDYFFGVTVLEIGSYDVNGSIRAHFTPTRYVGVDLVDGPGVDHVCLGHAFRWQERFDVAISTECFEHDPFYSATFANMVRHVRDGGMVLFTCASTGRAEHGTRRASPNNSPGTVAVGYDYYQNLTEADFADLLLPNPFVDCRFFRNAASHDLYFLGITREAAGKIAPGRLGAQLDALEARCAVIERLSIDCKAALELMRQGRIGEGIDRMQDALDRAPLVARDHLLGLQGALLLAAKRGEQAEAVVREAVTLADTADLYRQLATILQSLGRSSEAVESALRAVERAPGDAKCRYLLGAMLQRQNRLQEAEGALIYALGLEPTLAAAHQQLSMIRIKQQRWDEALMAARRAVELAPNDDWIRTHFERFSAQFANTRNH